MPRVAERYRTAEEILDKSTRVVQSDLGKHGVPAFVSLGLPAPVVVIRGSVAHAYYVVERQKRVTSKNADADQIAKWCEDAGYIITKVELRMVTVRNPFAAGKVVITPIKDFGFTKSYSHAPKKVNTTKNVAPMNQYYDADFFERKTDETVCPKCWMVRTPTGACGCI